MPRKQIIFLFFIITSLEIVPCSASEFQLLNFADNLMHRGEYYRAITEYYRFNSYNPHDKHVPMNLFKIAQCLELSGRYEDAMKEYKFIVETYPNAAISGAEKIAQIQSKTANYLGSNETIRNLRLTKGIKEDETNLVEAKNDIHLGNYQAATEILAEIKNRNDEVSPIAKNYLQIMHDGLPLKRKSKLLAGILGALCPGLGYLYASRPQTAAAALVVMGGLGYSTYGLFNKQIYGLGGVLSVVTAGFYTGSIYGSVQAVEKDNNAKKAVFLAHFNF